MLSWFINRYPFTYLKLILFFGTVFIVSLQYNPIPIGQSELSCRLLAENLSDGQNLYLDVRTNLAPLSAGFYRVLFSLGADKRLFYHLLALGVLLLQAFFFNSFLEKFKTFSQSNYFPFFFYLLFAHLNFELYYLSPFLLGQTCFLTALWLVASPPKNNYDLIYVGIIMALASLFHQVFLLFSVFLIWYIITGSKAKPLSKLMFFGYGFLLPCLATMLYFTAYQDMIANFIEQYFYVYDYSKYIDYDLNKIYLSIWLALVTFIMLINLVIGRHLKSKNLYFFVLSLSIGGGFFIFRGIFTPSYFLLLALPFSYYYTSFILAFKKSGAKIFCFCGGIVLILSFAYYNNNSVFKRDLNQKSNFIMAQKTPFKDEAILVLGDNFDYYLTNHLAGGYLNWGLSKTLFQNLHRPSNIVAINRQLVEQAPRIIIDLEGYMPQILKHLPLMKYHREKTIYYIRVD